MNEKFLAWLLAQGIVLREDQELLVFAIFFALQQKPSLFQVRSGKTFLFKKIDDFLNTLPHAEAIRPRKRKA